MGIGRWLRSTLGAGDAREACSREDIAFQLEALEPRLLLSADLPGMDCAPVLDRPLGEPGLVVELCPQGEDQQGDVSSVFLPGGLDLSDAGEQIRIQPDGVPSAESPENQPGGDSTVCLESSNVGLLEAGSEKTDEPAQMAIGSLPCGVEVEIQPGNSSVDMNQSAGTALAGQPSCLSNSVALPIDIRGPPETYADHLTSSRETTYTEPSQCDPEGSGSSLSTPNTIYLALDGAANVTYEGPILVSSIDVAAFKAPERLRGQEAAIVNSLLDSLKDISTSENVSFTTEKPSGGGEYSTIYIGGDDAPFAEYGPFVGLSEKIDPGNVDPSDIAFVFTDNLQSSAKTAAEYGTELAGYVAHEAGHLMGYEHVYQMEPDNPLAAVGWKPYTHVEIAKDVRLDLLTDGTLNIGGDTYAIHPRILQALREYPAYYYAGAVGPDGFPDLTFGQRTLHPVDTGTWVARVFDMAWAAQDANAPYTEQEKLQILAFAYGFATHAAGDLFGHTLVNEFAEGVFPAVVDVVQDERDLSNAIRHLMAEGYVGDATPGTDGDSDRTLLADGDISSDATNGIDLKVPTRFLYETLLTPFPEDPSAHAATGLANVDGNRRMRLDVDLATNSFVRLDGESFLDDGFGDLLPGVSVIYSFGFNANNGKFTVLEVTANAIRVAEPLSEGDGTGAGDEALVTLGDRGPIIDVFVDLQRTIDLTLATLGGPPARSFDDLLTELIPQIPNMGGDPADDPDPALLDELHRAYLANWSAAIDAGIRNWAEFGLACAKGLFDAQAKRDVQNSEGENVGIEADPARAEVEGDVGTIDTITAYLEDPNQDGDYSDSFINGYLAPMLGVPRQITDLQTLLQSFGEFLDDQIVGPLRLALNPITEVVADIKNIAKDLIKDVIKERWGIDVEQFELLSKLSNKMDVATVTIGDKVLPVFRPGDHEKLDAYMGIQGVANSEEVQDLLLHMPGVSFYDDAKLGLGQNVEFDKTKFAAYADSVTLSKMLLLSEDPVDHDPAATGELSRLMQNQLGSGAATYDFSKLNLVGDHGGNIMTATLPKPGEVLNYVETQRLGVDGLTMPLEHSNPDGTITSFLSDARPWLRLIDGNQNWRSDSYTTTTAMFRVNSGHDGDEKAIWTALVDPVHPVRVQVTWLSSVTVWLDDPDIPGANPYEVQLDPESHAVYRIYDDSTLIATATVDQQVFPTQVEDGGLAFNSLVDDDATDVSAFTIHSGTLRVELSNASAPQHQVIAGPLRIEPVDGSPARRVQLTRDPETLAEDPDNGYSEVGTHWTDFVYVTGSGNFPLWESEVLRPVFRSLFVDWQDGAEQFPDLGDPTSPDPNRTPIAPDVTPGPYLTPWGPAPADPVPPTDPAPLVVNLVVSGSPTHEFTGNVNLTGATGNGDASVDSLDLTVHGTLHISGPIGGGGLHDVSINADEIIIYPDVVLSSRQIATGGDPLTAGSTGDSGAILLESPHIVVGARTAIVADATGSFAAGSVVLRAEETEEINWSFGVDSVSFQSNDGRKRYFRLRGDYFQPRYPGRCDGRSSERVVPCRVTWSGQTFSWIHGQFYPRCPSAPAWCSRRRRTRRPPCATTGPWLTWAARFRSSPWRRNRTRLRPSRVLPTAPTSRSAGPSSSLAWATKPPRSSAPMCLWMGWARSRSIPTR